MFKVSIELQSVLGQSEMTHFLLADDVMSYPIGSVEIKTALYILSCVIATRIICSKHILNTL